MLIIGGEGGGVVIAEKDERVVMVNIIVRWR